MNKPIFNPVLPSWEYVPDVEPRVFGGRLYLYGSHDRFGGDSFCMNDYVGWSAPLAVEHGKAPLYFTFYGSGAVDFTAFNIE